MSIDKKTASNDLGTIVPEGQHRHKLVYLGRMEGELGGSYPLYQCRECGTSFEMFGGGKYATFYPEWAAERIGEQKETIEFVKDRPRSKIAGRVLGRGLAELMNIPCEPTGTRGFGSLFRGINVDGKKR